MVQAKQADLWEPTSEAELDELEEEGLQLAMLQPQTIALQASLAEGAPVRCLFCFFLSFRFFLPSAFPLLCFSSLLTLAPLCVSFLLLFLSCASPPF